MENAEQEFVSVVREYERVIYKVCYLYTTPNATLNDLYQDCLLYTSDAADDLLCVDLGGRRIIKKKNQAKTCLLYKSKTIHI